MFTRHFFRHIIFCSLFSISCLAVLSQAKPEKSATAAKARISVNRTRILLGEQLELSLNLEAVGDRMTRWPQVPDSLNHFEVLNRGNLDSSLSGNSITYNQVLTLTSFDGGQ
jgi:hypothetical protein